MRKPTALLLAAAAAFSAPGTALGFRSANPKERAAIVAVVKSENRWIRQQYEFLRSCSIEVARISTLNDQFAAFWLKPKYVFYDPRYWRCGWGGAYFSGAWLLKMVPPDRWSLGVKAIPNAVFRDLFGWGPPTTGTASRGKTFSQVGISIS